MENIKEIKIPTLFQTNQGKIEALEQDRMADYMSVVDLVNAPEWFDTENVYIDNVNIQRECIGHYIPIGENKDKTVYHLKYYDCSYISPLNIDEFKQLINKDN